jgi:hypothetical protein
MYFNKVHKDLDSCYDFNLRHFPMFFFVLLKFMCHHHLSNIFNKLYANRI